MVIVQLEESQTLRSFWLYKRVFDLVASILFLLLFSPLYLLIPLAIKITSKGPVFYKGLRMGWRGRPFYCWKFRTMCIDAQSKLATLLAQDPEAAKQWQLFHKLKNDPRLTPIGQFLRKSSLDELPQIWNVLKGDLSVVGPRPIDISSRETGYEEIYDKYGDKTQTILSVKPGLTSLWQLSGRNTLTIEQRAVLEEEYVRKQSFFLDIQIICKTIWILLLQKGAY